MLRTCMHPLAQLRGVIILQRLSVASNAIDHPSLGHNNDNNNWSIFNYIQKISSHAYKLKLPPSFRIHPVIHIRYLTKHNPTDKFSSREIIPPPETVMDDGTIEFEVDSILSHRVRKYGRGSRLEYLVHWKGYKSHDDTWEPLRNLENCQELVTDYDNKFRHDNPQINTLGNLFII